ncbi:uncharacterized protein LOC144652266 [Oculina patagonica]
MKIAVEGCCHGELDKIYETLEHLEKKENVKVDLLLCCGDFEAVRNEADLCCMAVPPKYRHMETFYKYYSGEKKAPVLTVFIGGNHEATNHLWELPYGGWVAPNIYYLGYSGVVNFGGIRIGGLSGIYKGHDYNKGHFEKPPYNDSTVRSAYHVRSFDVFMLKLISQPIDIFMSHDWPRGVYHHGNLQELYRFKEFLRPEIESNTLGSPPAGELLALLKPKYWFAAHMHAKFPALVPHECQDGLKFTKFLALDKCLPKRQFLQVIDVGPATAPLELTYDFEWLAITKLTNPLNNLTPRITVLPNPEQMAKFRPDDGVIGDIVKVFGNPPKIPENFQITTAPYNPNEPRKTKMKQVPPVMNPQTETFCSMLGIANPCCSEKTASACPNPEEIDLSDVDDSDALQGNPEEIDIDDDNNDGAIFDNSDVANNIGANSMNKPSQNRSLLELPKPVNTFLESTDHSEISADHTSVADSKKPECLIPEGVAQDNSGLEPQNKVMKLKRRNQSLYTSNDNDEDSDN